MDNTKFSDLWPNITKKRAEDVPQDQEKWRGVKDKLKYLRKKIRLKNNLKIPFHNLTNIRLIFQK